MFGTFFTFSASDTAQVITYAGNLISDISPVLLIYVGVAVGVLILAAIVNAAKH